MQDSKTTDNFKTRHITGHIGLDLYIGHTLKGVIGGYAGYLYTTLQKVEPTFKIQDSGYTLGGRLGIALRLGNHAELEIGARLGYNQRLSLNEEPLHNTRFNTFYTNGYGAIKFLF